MWRYKSSLLCGPQFPPLYEEEVVSVISKESLSLSASSSTFILHLAWCNWTLAVGGTLAVITGPAPRLEGWAKSKWLFGQWHLSSFVCDSGKTAELEQPWVSCLILTETLSRWGQQQRPTKVKKLASVDWISHMPSRGLVAFRLCHHMTLCGLLVTLLSRGCCSRADLATHNSLWQVCTSSPSCLVFFKLSHSVVSDF